MPTIQGRFRTIFVRTGALVAAGLLAATPLAPAGADDPQAATAPAVLEAPAAVLPESLGPRDAQLYREIFALQAGGNWKAADERIAGLDDRVLLGHVLFQRYMHPTAYRSKYKELKAWMADYADHPGADRVYRLAMKRRPGGAAKPKRPVKVKVSLKGEAGVTPYTSTKKLSKSQRRRARAIKRKVRSNVLRTRLTVTEKLLKGAEAEKLLDTVERDQGFGQVAAGWYY
jgi:hypothetical protein